MPNHQNRTTQHPRNFSTLAGEFKSLARHRKHRVEFRPMNSEDARAYRLWTWLVAYGALGLVVWFGTMLFDQSHWIIRLEPDSSTHILNLIMLACLFLLQAFWIIGTYSATRATTKARTPYPVRPPQKLKVAFVTTRAPGEPVDMAETTLRAIKQVRYKGGKVDVWLLDETHDQQLIDTCMQLGIKYFSRSGIEKWNTPKPDAKKFKRLIALPIRLLSFGKWRGPRAIRPDQLLAARTKHGNFNAWRAYLKEQGLEYDILCGVDTDHVPRENYLERMLGYFRDQDVAYVVGPQVYGNYSAGIKNLVARWAESQASFFQSTIQRAANHSGVPMFVGTNYAVRMAVLDQIGGFQPCITEDMATGLAIHTTRNPLTGKRWRSVYTPDVLAVGEGPDKWGPYFTQQWRWAAGTFDTWKRVVWRKFFRLSPRAFLHYFLVLTFYPIMALTWLLGMVSSLIYLFSGATALLAPWNEFLALYMMTVVLQLSLYFWNRRFNVSPHEPAGSFGFPGIVITSLAAPIYLSALFGVVIGRKVKFVVTTKGENTGSDNWMAFKLQLQWSVLLIAAISYGWAEGNNHPAMLVWVFTQLVVCLTPIIINSLSRASSFNLSVDRKLAAEKGVLNNA
jgi:cellulose synthase/poly-beta-1,6-N-acetylglucosamine synthase-like glycosyltransferase